MLNVKPRGKREIRRVYREGKALFLEQESGIIRILPETERIVRVSYTESGVFSEEQGAELAELSGAISWSYQEDKTNICLETGYLSVVINRKTGSISYAKADGTRLLSERAEESKTVELFKAYKMVVNENTKIEEINTADGIKRKITKADREFDKNLYHTRLFLEFESEERLYGLGQAEEGVWNLRHTTQYLHQANLKIAIPLLLSSKNYGILLSTQSPVIFSDTQYGTYFYTEADEYLDYYFLAGGCLDEVVSGFRQLTGQAVMLPKWAFGYMQSQERYETEWELLETASTFREKGIGLDTIILDWMSWKGSLWGQKTLDEERFPDPAGMIERLHHMDVHFMVSIWPNMAEMSENYAEFLQKGLLLPASNIYDAFSPAGRKLYWEQVQRGLHRYGVDAWWCDSNEPVAPEWERKGKPEPGEMYQAFVAAASSYIPIQKTNAYGLYHAQAVYEGQRNCSNEKRVVILTRNGYTGSQKYAAILWSGDTSASWETLKRQIVAGLHFCASGLPYWTLDIGAFFVKKGEPWYWNGQYEEGINDLGYRELYVRWFQYGAFLPVFRSHGTDCRREPWFYGDKGEPFYEAIVSAIKLRYQLLPYIYSVAGDVWRNDVTMMRLLAFDFSEDNRALDISDEFMFGSSLLVCPVTVPMYYYAGGVPVENPVRTRKVYLPAGTDWYDLRTGDRFTGGQDVIAKADIDSIPVYVRAGAIIPTMNAGNSTVQMDGDDILLKVYAGNDGSFELYEDAGDGYGYETGEYCRTTIFYHDKKRKVEWKTEGEDVFRNGKINVEIIG